MSFFLKAYALIMQDILLADPSLKRSSEDTKLLDSCASIKSPLVLNSRKSRWKREHSPSDAADSWEHSCPQCDTEFGGYKCNESTIHLQCQACGGMIPSRLNIGVQQHCLGCDRAFCAAYWHSQGVNGSNSHPLCSRETFKPIVCIQILEFPPWHMRRIILNKISLKDALDRWEGRCKMW
ncbi:hypothetical protein RND71_040306 [Anisodus tanguticus]|uniref:E3 ubiquitin-protein ligase CHFR cysteine rich domain-containing protein n=1 Tax=Anisodus tanguticus TaxID=243964 RepID=A0AAE1UVL9_9SOLA|nr:hypothetical protein RND71_040306 [Anisodus tanguticus]